MSRVSCRPCWCTGSSVKMVICAIVEAIEPRLHVPFKALRKLVYVKLILCKRTKAVSKPIRLNHIPRWFGTGLKRFRRACKQLKRYKPLLTKSQNSWRCGLKLLPQGLQEGVDREAVWADNEVKALIAVWGEGNVQEELDGAVRNRAVYKKIAQKLQEIGFNRDWKQCRDKIKNLKTKYKEVKDSNKETRRGRKSCKFFGEMDAILGHRPATAPSALFDSYFSTGESQNSEVDVNGK